MGRGFLERPLRHRPRRRARELRDLAREDPQLVADDLARVVDRPRDVDGRARGGRERGPAPQKPPARPASGESAPGFPMRTSRPSPPGPTLPDAPLAGHAMARKAVPCRSSRPGCRPVSGHPRDAAERRRPGLTVRQAAWWWKREPAVSAYLPLRLTHVEVTRLIACRSLLVCHCRSGPWERVSPATSPSLTGPR